MRKHATGMRLAAATAACIASLGFAACGDDDDEGGDSTSTSESSGATGESGASFEDQVRTSLEQQGLSDAVIDCVFEEGESIESTDEELEDLQNGELSDRLTQELSDLGVDCQAEEG